MALTETAFQYSHVNEDIDVCRNTAEMYGLRRALYEGFCMSFSTMLEADSRKKVVQLITEAIYPVAMFGRFCEVFQDVRMVNLSSWDTTGSKKVQMNVKNSHSMS